MSTSTEEEEEEDMDVEIVDASKDKMDVVDDDDDKEEVLDSDTSLLMLCMRRGCSKTSKSNIFCRTCKVLMLGEVNYCSEACMNHHISESHTDFDVDHCAKQPIPPTPSPKKNQEQDVVVLSYSPDDEEKEEEEEEEEEEENNRGSYSFQRKDQSPPTLLREAMENMKLESSCCLENPSLAKCTRWIQGVRVLFPHTKPHKNQMFLMISTIEALINRGHAALESPTGTGKTAALLCAALAWHATFQEKRDKLIEAARIKEKNKNNTTTTTTSSSSSSTGLTQAMKDNASIASQESKKNRSREKKKQSDEDIAKAFLPAGYQTKESKPCRIFYGTRTQAQVKNVVRELRALAYSPDLAVLGSRQFLCACKDELKEKSPAGLPLGIACMQRIRNKNLTHEDGVNNDENGGTDGGGIDEPGCQYYQNLEQPSLASALFERSRGEKKVIMDLEDLSDFMVRNDYEEDDEDKGFNKSCPYFASQVLMGDAHLVVCPYNYILDPGIREAMGIDLNDSAVILDEAHNMSGVCRDAGSVEIKLQQLLELEQLCCVFACLNRWNHDGKSVADCAKRWVKFLEKVVSNMLRNDEEVPIPSRLNRYADATEHAMSMFMSSSPSSSSSSSTKKKTRMSVQNVRGNVDTLLCSLFSSVDAAQLEIELLRSDACTIFDAVLEKGRKMMKHVPLLKNLNHLSSCLTLMYQNKDKYVSGYLRLELDDDDPSIGRVASISTCPEDKCSKLHKANRFVNVDSLRNMQQGNYRRLRWVIWLMDASVTFGQVARASHSVILASGTLHPMDALLSELGNDFNRRLRRVSRDASAPVRFCFCLSFSLFLSLLYLFTHIRTHPYSHPHTRYGCARIKVCTFWNNNENNSGLLQLDAVR